jgi:hypothetical protein
LLPANVINAGAVGAVWMSSLMSLRLKALISWPHVQEDSESHELFQRRCNIL